LIVAGGDWLTVAATAGTVACMSGPDTASLASRRDGDLAREVASVSAGEAAAAEGELYRRFARRVRLFGLKHLRDDMAADDLAQQVMLIAIERLRA
jgi:RNA polymerase sigma-70 factor (ECF subfamily)